MEQTNNEIIKKLNIELGELDLKRQKLSAFIDDSEKFSKVNNRHQILLIEQLLLMTQYADILKLRIVNLQTDGTTNKTRR